MQIIAVVVGILLALLINDWVMQRQQQSEVTEALHAIRAELGANSAALREHATGMFEMAREMQDAPQNRNQPPRPCYLWNRWHGIGGLNLTDAAYQTAIATQALANMPFAEAHEVAQVYGWQTYRQKGVESDAMLLMGQPQSLTFCVGVIREIGRGDLDLEKVYAPLIGPDKARLPGPPPVPSESPASR